ncbi:unnamed protein product [Durusdinium trenchii]|uniref:Histone RNA hairpin-binding protein RNA-binding domain-containing protein n=1 Tax=Durusdinium trenchii TaxID=1381693 RepID=A0ABP0SDU2_9DINO
MSTIVAQPGSRQRWADMVDSQSQESLGEIQTQPPPPIHQDSYQESQASQVCSQGGICDLLQSKAEIEDTQEAPPTRLTRRKHLQEDADGSDDEMTLPRGQKRENKAMETTGSSSAAAPATKRQRSFPQEEVRPAPGDAVVHPATTAPEAMDDHGTDDAASTGDDAVAARMRKRYRLIQVHKSRDDYQLFNAARPRDVRTEDEPHTPDPTAHPSKRQWESVVQKWREGLREQLGMLVRGCWDFHRPEFVGVAGVRWSGGLSLPAEVERWNMGMVEDLFFSRTRIIHLSDADGNDELDFQEFLHVMSTHELTHTKALRSAFQKNAGLGGTTCSREEVSNLLQKLGYFPGEEELDGIFTSDANGVEDFDFNLTRVVTTSCRRHLAKVARCNAYFPEVHLQILEKMFQEQLLSSGSRLERGGMICLLQGFGVPMNTLQERDAILALVDPARRSAQVAGADHGEFGSHMLTFPVLLHLLRKIASNGQMQVMARELKAMKDAKVSHAEVVEFRQVFNQLAIEAKLEKSPPKLQALQAAAAASPGGRRRSMPDLSAMMAANPAFSGIDADPNFQALKASLFINGNALCISVTALIGMLRSLGVRISEKQLLELTNKVRQLAEEEDLAVDLTQGVDFAAFLRVIRWMLDVNFGDINTRAASKARTKAPLRARSHHALPDTSEDPPPTRTQRRRASAF